MERIEWFWACEIRNGWDTGCIIKSCPARSFQTWIWSEIEPDLGDIYVEATVKGIRKTPTDSSKKNKYCETIAEDRSSDNTCV